MLATLFPSLPSHALFFIFKKDQFACIFHGAVQPHTSMYLHVLFPCLECHLSCLLSFRTTTKGQLLGNFTSGWCPSSYYGRSSFSPYHAIFNYLNVCLLDCDLLEDRVCVLYRHAQCLAQRKGSIDINGRNEEWDDPRGMRKKRKWSL